MGTPAAIFDVDRTLVRGGTERLFFRYLVLKGRLRPASAMRFLARLLFNSRHRFSDKSYLKGMPVAEAVTWARGCYQEVIRPRLLPRAVSCLRTHQALGRRIVLLSGSLAFLLEPLKQELQADWLLATQLEQADGVFTGAIRGVHPRGENKGFLLRELAFREGLDLSLSYGYGDHEEDIPFLRLVGFPVAVNPSRRLARLAKDLDWTLASF